MRKKGSVTRTASLEEITRMRERGELFHDPNAPVGPSLGADFWKHAKLVMPPAKRPVHLKIDRDVFDYFVRESGGKGHLTKMQNVLKSYAEAMKGSPPAQRPKTKRPRIRAAE
jgi:uncharacterized protein (DUF4415 family)